MKKLLLIIFTLVVLILIDGCTKSTTTSNKQKTLVIAAYGGEYEQILKEVIIKPFEEMYNTKVIIDPAGSGAEKYAKIKASQGNPGWDLVVLTAPETILGGREGLLEKITENEVPNLKYIYPSLKQLVYPYGAVQELQYMGLIYNTNTVKTPPNSWDELWNSTYKDRVIIYDTSNLMGVYTLLLAAKMEVGNMYDIEAGFRKLEKLKSNTLTTLISSSEVVRYFISNRADIATSWDGRAHYYKDCGVPLDIVIPEEGALLIVPTLSIPKKAANKSLAYKFINFWLSKEVQKKWAEAYRVGPVRSDIDLSEDFKKLHITSEADIKKTILPNPLFIAERREELAEKWKKVMSR